MNKESFDLTPCFLKAKHLQDDGYPISDLHEAIKKFSESNGLAYHWDKNDGERWGEVYCEGEFGNSFIFHAYLPIIFTNTVLYNKLIKHLILSNCPLPVILLEDDRDNAHYFFSYDDVGKHIEWSGKDTATGLSINDIWFYSI